MDTICYCDCKIDQYSKQYSGYPKLMSLSTFNAIKQYIDQLISYAECNDIKLPNSSSFYERSWHSYLMGGLKYCYFEYSDHTLYKISNIKSIPDTELGRVYALLDMMFKMYDTSDPFNDVYNKLPKYVIDYDERCIVNVDSYAYCTKVMF